MKTQDEARATPLQGEIPWRFLSAEGHLFSIDRGGFISIFTHSGTENQLSLRLSAASRTLLGVSMPVGKHRFLLELYTRFNPEFPGRENVYAKGTLLGFSKRR